MNAAIPLSKCEHNTVTEIRALADQAFSRAAGAPLIGGNSVRLLKDARENYPAWLDAIGAAKRHIHFESFIIHEDHTGRKFADALIGKAQEGVRVRLIYDWIGGFGKTSRRFWNRLRAGRVDVRCYNPPRLDSPFGWLSRDHRKMLSVDGQVGFVAGLCVGRMWEGVPEKKIEPWRDTGIEVRGPAVADIEQAFAQVWAMIGEPIPEYELASRDALEQAGETAVRIVANIPAMAGTFRLDQLVSALARKRLWLTDAYYAGTTAYVQALRAAAKDGVDVRLLVPNATDVPLLRPLSRAGYRPLLEAGVRVFEWNGTMVHAKTAVADGHWARVGSTNLNISSWLGNCELDAVVENELFAREMEEMYLHDLTNATEVVLDAKRKVRAPGEPPHPHPMMTSGGGISGRAAAGAVRIGNAVGAAFTNRRVLGPAEARLMTSVGALVLILVALFAVFPRVLAYPLLIIFAWLGGALLYRSYKLYRKGRRKKNAHAIVAEAKDTILMSPATVQPDQISPYQQPFGEVLVAFDTDARRGLSEGEAWARLERYGKNELTAEKPVPAWRKFLAQFQDVLVILLLGATLISAVLWLYEREPALPYEAMAIFAVVLLNAIMGYIQQSRAEEAVAALRQMSAAHASVIRDNERQSIPAAEVVPGDILLIEEGDTVPADARLIQETALQTAEAALTGESLPVSKDTLPITEEVGLGDRHNMIFSGTAATYGRGSAVVTATGMQTQMGRIAGMLKEAPIETTPLQKELDRVGKLLGIIVVLIAVVMIVTIILVEDVRGFAALFDVLILGVALAVAAVPEGLPAVVTAVLSLGVQRMARRNAVVRHLAAVETLGSANIIASDKTGTLTKNEMTVRVVVTASGRVRLGGTGYEPEGEVRRDGGGSIDGVLRFEFVRALAAADRANNAVLQERDGRWAVQGDPTEGALIVAARKAGLEARDLDARLERVGEVPFSSERKLMSTVHSDAEREERLLVFTKGAPDILLTRCSRELVGEEARPLTEDRRMEILKSNEELAAEALRTLGVAFRSLPKDALKLNQEEVDERVEQELVFLGLIGMIDPPREEAKDAVARAKGAGIRLIMITGDHPKTAAVIAGELGIVENGRAVTGAEVEKLSDDALGRTAAEVSVYARVNPEHKLRIVKALQRGGAVVAMTGDGVNDAPALKTADIGIAMGMTGTDVSKEAADMVLSDDNFATIVAAIEEGRAIFSNIRRFLRYLLSSNIGEVMTMFFGVLLADVIGLTAEGGGGMVLPLLATQILWINLVTDGAPALALGVDPADAGIMNDLPRPRGEGVVTRNMWVGIFFVGAIVAAGMLLVLDASLPGGLIEGSGNLRYAQTMAFTTLVFFSLFNVFNARSDERSAFVGMFSNRWLWGAVLLSLLLQAAVIYIPFLQHAFSTVNLSLGDWLCCTVVASSVLWLRELSKVVTRATSRK